jgi:hypothetical protein
MTMMRPRLITAAALTICALTTRGAFAGAHTWRVSEVFSNADGTIQFVELTESGGGTGEIGVNGHQVTSLTKSYTIPAPSLVSPTSFKSLLFATPAFAALPGAPTPDYIFPAATHVPFFSTAGGADTFQYVAFDSWSVPAGSIPLDGYNSFNRTGGVLPNTPKNYAGVQRTIDLRPPTPPAVPDGGGTGTAMTVTPLDLMGDTLQIDFDTATCSGDAGWHIVYGQKTDLPTSAGGSFVLDGSVCAVGASPFTWNQVPDGTDGFGLIWWLILANDGATIEGSWGQNSANVERLGPQADGSSGVCGITKKVLTNTCGN